MPMSLPKMCISEQIITNLKGFHEKRIMGFAITQIQYFFSEMEILKTNMQLVWF